jgi:hypothetical protein
MPQFKKPFDEVRVPFAKMSFTPDIPSTQLGPNEYNAGDNVETDVRGIRSVSGEEEIFNAGPPGTPTYISGGFRANDRFWTIVATDEGYWYTSAGGNWYDITPINGPFSYNQSSNITEAWNGTVPIYNDESNPPMFWPDSQRTVLDITAASGTGSVCTLQFANPGFVPFEVGQEIVVEFIVPLGYRGVRTVTACTNNSVSYAGTASGPMTIAGIVGNAYPRMIMYSNRLPNAISTIADAGAGLATVTLSEAYPVTLPFNIGEEIVITGVGVGWDGTYTVVNSGNNTVLINFTVPSTYPTGVVGSLAPRYQWNYNPEWKSVYAKFLRIYNTPNVGSILVAGNLTATLLDGLVEIYPVTVQWSQAFGLNQVPYTWEPTILNVANPLEVPLRGEAIDAFPSGGQLFISSYWDTVVFSPINYATTSAPILGVRLFSQGRGMLTSNCWANTDKMIYGIDARDIWVFDGQNFTGLGNQRVKNWFFDQLDPLYADRVHMQVNTQKNQVEIYYPTQSAINGVPNKMLSYRYDLDCWNPPRDVASATMACETPVRYYDAAAFRWRFDKASRTIMYARGVLDQRIVQTNQGYSFVPTEENPTGAIASYWRRDNIKMLPDYSGKLLVHRILPEIINLTDNGLPIDPATDTDLIGTVGIQVEGANSVGQAPQSTITHDLATDTDNPWVQINQNAFRVNAIELSNTSTENIWMCNATTWQYTQTEDDR